MAKIDSETAPNIRPIGIFDSGIGGLSIAQCISNKLPNEQLVYIADAKFSPYGKLSEAQIKARVHYLAEQLLAMKAKAIVIACNTATVSAIDDLRREINIPIIGIEPAIKPAAKLSKTRSIGLLVTQTTAKNGRFLQLVERHKTDAQVHIQPCPDLANVIEQGFANTEKSQVLLEKYLAPLMAKNIDALVLGCTHYPFVSEQIKRIIGTHVQLIETAEPVTNELIRQLTNHSLLTSNQEPNLDSLKNHLKVYSSQPTTSLTKSLMQLWPEISISVELLK